MMMYQQDLESLCRYPMGIFCMGTDIRCERRGLSYILRISHKGKYNKGDNWVIMHDNLGLWGSGCDIVDIRRTAISFRESGKCNDFYMMVALFPREELCRQSSS